MKFYKNGIYQLESQWKKVIKANSLYFHQIKIIISKMYCFLFDQGKQFYLKVDSIEHWKIMKLFIKGKYQFDNKRERKQ